LLISMQVVILIVWAVVSPFSILREDRRECISDSSTQFTIALATIEGVVCLLALYYGYRVRAIPHEFNDTRVQTWVLYNGGLVCVVLFTVINALGSDGLNAGKSTLIQCLGLCYVMSVAILLLFGPKVMELIRQRTEGSGFSTGSTRNTNNNNDNNNSHPSLEPNASINASDMDTNTPGEEHEVSEQEYNSRLQAIQAEIQRLETEYSRQLKTVAGTKAEVNLLTAVHSGLSVDFLYADFVARKRDGLPLNRPRARPISKSPPVVISSTPDSSPKNAR